MTDVLEPREALHQQRPLVVHFGRMGDMVMLLPLIAALHRRFGALVDIVCSGHSTRALLERQPGVGTLFWIRSRKDAYWRTPRQWRLVRALRERGAGPTFLCDFRADEGRRLVARAGIHPSFIVDVRAWPRAPREHVVDHWLRFACVTPDGACARSHPGAAASPPMPTLIVTPEQRTELDAWLDSQDLDGRPLVLVQAGSRSTTRWGRAFRRPANQKYWPVERWARVIDGIASLERHARVLLVGVPNEARINARILRHVRTTRAIDVAREMPIGRLLALQERARGMISADTGPAHSAAALACPLVVLFGIEDPQVYAPRATYGEVAYLSGAVNGERSMLGIEPDQVIAAWRHLDRRQIPDAARVARAYGSSFTVPAMYGRSAAGTVTDPSSF